MSDRIESKFYRAVRNFFRPLLRLYLRLSTDGLEHVPSDGRCIVVANHASFLDPLVLGAACPRMLHFWILDSVYRRRVLLWFYRGMQAIPVRGGKDLGSVRLSLDLLGRERALGIFPEGGRSADGSMGDARLGAVLLALRTGTPVVPAAIVGTFESYPPGRWLPRPGQVRVVFGPPLELDAANGRRPSRVELERAADVVMTEIATLSGERSAPLRGER